MVYWLLAVSQYILVLGRLFLKSWRMELHVLILIHNKYLQFTFWHCSLFRGINIVLPMYCSCFFSLMDDNITWLRLELMWGNRFLRHQMCVSIFLEIRFNLCLVILMFYGININEKLGLNFIDFVLLNSTLIIFLFYN